MKGFTIFDYADYKSYLKALLKNGPRGEQGRLAVALRCHSGYLSQVLLGNSHLSQEQGVDLNVFFGHSKAAAHYFLLLLQHARAGTPGLREYIEEQMHLVLEQQLNLKARFQVKDKISAADQALIYSSWHYTAIHLAVLIPRLKTVPALAQYLGISPERVREVVETLVRAGLVEEQGNKLSIGQKVVHLGRDSPFISKHHANWRLQALASLDRNRSSDLHYSSVVTIGKSDVKKVREILVRAIEEVRATIKPSPDEALYCYAIDWFSVGQE